jgi:hypothetical protein
MTLLVTWITGQYHIVPQLAVVAEIRPRGAEFKSSTLKNGTHAVGIFGKVPYFFYGFPFSSPARTNNTKAPPLPIEAPTVSTKKSYGTDTFLSNPKRRGFHSDWYRQPEEKQGIIHPFPLSKRVP